MTWHSLVPSLFRLPSMADAEAERQLLAAIAGAPPDTGFDSATLGWEASVLVGLIKSLESAELVTAKAVDHVRWAVTAEGREYVAGGTPEARVWDAAGGAGVPLADLKTMLGADVADVGFKQAMALKAVKLNKGDVPVVVRLADVFTDTVRQQLAAVDQGQAASVSDADLGVLAKKRKLIEQQSWKTYILSKGPQFALERAKAATELTSEMMKDGTWKSTQFKAYNFAPLAGAPPTGGHLHPLLKVRDAFRSIFLHMGFAEMSTNNFVESSFWNFDTLIQPQQHPARDAHDTFFMATPAKALSAPEAYLARVQAMHEATYAYAWKRAEADKNILRTHTTAVSARLLAALAQRCDSGQPWTPFKAFSIDRVFRNEAVDKTHLAEFHQVEGLIADRNLTLGHLLGVLQQFFARLGMSKLRYKPAFNPYTEPSMEVFAFHPMLNKWVEVGNSGMFRPEMLRPMGVPGLPDDVNVIAWGLSLERPTMILYGVDNIRDLFGTKVNLSMIKSNPICRLALDTTPFP